MVRVHVLVSLRQCLWPEGYFRLSMLQTGVYLRRS